MFQHPSASSHHLRKSEDAATATTTLRGSVDADQEKEASVGQLVAVARPPERRSHVAMLQPLMATAIHHESLASITFREDAVLTSDKRGHIKVWKRPTSSSLPAPTSSAYI